MSKSSLEHVGVYHGCQVRYDLEGSTAEMTAPGGAKETFQSDPPLAKDATAAQRAAWQSGLLKAIRAAKQQQAAADAAAAAQVDEKLDQIKTKQQAVAAKSPPKPAEPEDAKQ